MKKILLTIIIAFGIFGLTGCGNTQTSDSISSDNKASQSAESAVDKDESGAGNSDKRSVLETAPEPETEEISDSTEKGTLVVYFSATGTTKGVAERIASVTNADLYEIIPAEPYSSDDLDWHDSSSRTSIEMNDPDTRPAIASDTVSLDGYSTIYIGYPIWWGEAPRIMSTFVESYNFDNITVIPFCTSGSSDIGSSGGNLRDLAGSGNWFSGDRLDANISESEIQKWISTHFDKTMKVGASVVAARRGGLSSTFDELNKYFTITGMPVASSQYWNSIHGESPGEAQQDAEGLQTMRTLAKNMAFLMKSIQLGKEKFGLPEKEEHLWTNFIR